MIDSAAMAVQRNVFRFALTGLVGIWLSGCSADAGRFGEPMGNPFSNPFSAASNDASAPTPRVSSGPLASAQPANPSYVASAHPSPVVVSALPTPAPTSTGQIHPLSAPVGGSANGWSAVGGSPVIVAEGDNLDGVSRRYGVPTSALLSANGLSSPSQVHGGMRIVVPVYNAGGKTASIAPATLAPVEKPRKPEVAEVETPKSKAVKAKAKATADSEDADNLDAKAKAKVKAKKPFAKLAAEPAPAPQMLTKPEKPEKVEKAAKAEKPEKVEKVKVAVAPAAPPAVIAKADPAVKPGKKKADADMTPNGAVNPNAATAVTAQQADASGASPEFRWPARGRIIQGFKAGGNDGINISVPEGTSVRAAEDGKVAYAGSALKGYGNLVLIRHPNGFVSAYANNGELNVKNGDTVKRGQVIAKSGQSGDVSSPQLHFELRKGSTPVDPTSYLAGI